MKKITFFILLIILLLITILSIAGCNKKKTITYVWNETNTIEKSVEVGTQVTALEEIEMEGYAFSGWFEDEERTVPCEFTVMPNRDVTLYALWIPVYTVIYEAGLTVDVVPQEVISGYKLLMPYVIRDGYTLEGWYISYNEGYTLDEKWSFFNDVVTSDVILYANWVSDELPDFTVYFDANGGECSINAMEVTRGKTVGQLPTATRTGYTFWGWNTKSDGTGDTLDVDDEYTFESNTILYAKLNKNFYSLTYNKNYGDEIIFSGFVPYSYGQVINEPDPLIREGYTFGGWYTDKNCIERYIFGTMPAYNLTIYAYWIPEYTVSLISNGGTEMEEITVIEGDRLSLPECTREGYLLEGWYVSYNEGITFDEKWSFTSDTISGDLMLYANWVAE